MVNRQKSSVPSLPYSHQLNPDFAAKLLKNVNMYKLAVVALFALIVVAQAVPPLISGISYRQRVQTHVPVGVVGYGLGHGLGYGGLYGGYGLGYGGLYGGYGGLGYGHGGLIHG